MGTKEGGNKAAATNRFRYGLHVYEEIGRMGGKHKHPRPFALNRELAVRAGKLGGRAQKNWAQESPQPRPCEVCLTILTPLSIRPNRRTCGKECQYILMRRTLEGLHRK